MEELQRAQVRVESAASSASLPRVAHSTSGPVVANMRPGPPAPLGLRQRKAGASQLLWSSHALLDLVDEFEQESVRHGGRVAKDLLEAAEAAAAHDTEDPEKATGSRPGHRRGVASSSRAVAPERSGAHRSDGAAGRAGEAQAFLESTFEEAAVVLVARAAAFREEGAIAAEALREQYEREHERAEEVLACLRSEAEAAYVATATPSSTSFSGADGAATPATASAATAALSQDGAEGIGDDVAPMEAARRLLLVVLGHRPDEIPCLHSEMRALRDRTERDAVELENLQGWYNAARNAVELQHDELHCEQEEVARLREQNAAQALERGRLIGDLVRAQEWCGAYEATAKHEALAAHELRSELAYMSAHSRVQEWCPASRPSREAPLDRASSGGAPPQPWESHKQQSEELAPKAVAAPLRPRPSRCIVHPPNAPRARSGTVPVAVEPLEPGAAPDAAWARHHLETIPESARETSSDSSPPWQGTDAPQDFRAELLGVDAMGADQMALRRELAEAQAATVEAMVQRETLEEALAELRQEHAAVLVALRSGARLQRSADSSQRSSPAAGVFEMPGPSACGRAICAAQEQQPRYAAGV